mgnify:CR=1 FL=1
MPAPAVPGAIISTIEGINAARDLVAADPATLNPVERGIRAGVRQYCRGAANLPFGHYTLGPAHGATGSYVCAPYHDEQGNDPGQPPQPPPFTGGQCPVTYNVTYRLVSDDGNSPGDGSFASCPNTLGPISTQIREVSGLVFGGIVDGGGVERCSRALSASVSNPRVEIQSVVRVDGLPDDCGDPPGTPATPPIVGDPYPWGVPEVEPLTGVPTFVDEPTSGPEGITINIDGGDINIPFSGDPGAIPPPRPEDGPLAEGMPQPGGTGAGGEDFGDPPDGFVWVGARWELDNVPEGFGLIAGTLGNAVYPRVLGNIRLRLSAVEGGAQFPTDDIRLDVERGAILRPSAGFKVLGTYSNVIAGLVLTITPIAGKLEE